MRTRIRILTFTDGRLWFPSSGSIHVQLLLLLGKRRSILVVYPYVQPTDQVLGRLAAQRFVLERNVALFLVDETERKGFSCVRCYVFFREGIPNDRETKKRGRKSFVGVGIER